jgi:hypothetical protein
MAASFLFVALALLYLSYNFNSDVLRYALLCSTLSIAVKPKLSSLHLTGDTTEIIVTISNDSRTRKPKDSSSRRPP